MAAVLAVAPNTNYTLSAKIYRTTSQGSAFVDLSGIAEQVKLTAAPGVVNQWQVVSGVWNSGSLDSVRVRATRDGARGGGEVWWDEVKLTPNQCPISTECVATNLIYNSHFETQGSAQNLAHGWAQSGTQRVQKDGGWTMSHSQSTGCGGDCSARQDVAVTPNAQYVFSVWIYREAIHGNAYIDMSDMAGESQPFLGDQQGPANVWIPVSGVWTNGAHTSISVRTVRDNAHHSGEVWFDEISLAPVIANLVVNPGFESSGSWDLVRTQRGQKDGANALQSSADCTENCMATASASISVSAHTHYLFSARIFRTATHGRAYIDMNNAEDQIEVGLGDGEGAASVWTQVSGFWNSGSTTSVTVRVMRTQADSSGEVWWDDISLQPLCNAQ